MKKLHLLVLIVNLIVIASFTPAMFNPGRMTSSQKAYAMNAGNSIVIDLLISAVTPVQGSQVSNLELRKFEKMKEPVMKPGNKGFDSRNVYNMAMIREDDVTYMLYRGEDKDEPAGKCTGRIGLATSRDGIHFEREAKPVIIPENDYEKSGIEDPRLVKVDGTYYLTYTAYDGKNAKLCLALSKDLRKWDKKGPIFPVFAATKDWTKSGAILPQKIKSGKYEGKYVMYFGDTNIWMAHSEDLIHWTAVPEPVIKPREDRFDSKLVEPGPPPMLTSRGILMIYNSAQKDYCYNVGAVLFDSADPGKITARTEKPVMSPTQPWEKTGYVNNVVFAESLTVHGGSVYLYYGGADRYIGLAIAKCLTK